MWNEATSAPFPVAGRRPIRFPSRDSDRTIPPSLSIGSHWKYFEVTYYVVLEPHKITSIALSHQTSIRFVSTGGHRAERPLNVKANGRHCGLDLMRCLCYETVYKIVATSWKQNGLCFCIVSHVIEYCWDRRSSVALTRVPYLLVTSYYAIVSQTNDTVYQFSTKGKWKPHHTDENRFVSSMQLPSVTFVFQELVTEKVLSQASNSAQC